MILHIFNKQEKFSVPLFQFFEDYGIKKEENIIFHYGKSSGTLEKMGWNAIFSSYFDVSKHLKLYSLMTEADKIIIHSLASPFLLLLLMFNTKVSHKFYWIIWGKDLYFKESVNMRNPINFVYEIVRKLSLKNVRHVLTNGKGDYELAKEWYGLNAEFHEMEGVVYPYNSSVVVEKNINWRENCQKILLGNSASKSNAHLEALDMLKQKDDGHMEIICPLSYGGKQKYIDSVVLKGNQLFGERFKPLLEFFSLEEYNNILNQVDIAYFYHNRQEAFNNTLTLIGRGKKVYIRKCSNLWEFFIDRGVIIHDSEKLDDAFLCNDALSIIKDNQEKVLNIVSPELSAIAWKKAIN